MIIVLRRSVSFFLSACFTTKLAIRPHYEFSRMPYDDYNVKLYPVQNFETRDG